MLVNTLKVFLFVSFLCSCSSPPSAKAKFNPAYNFSEIKSYSVLERNSAFGDIQNMSDVTRSSIEIAIEHAFDDLGYQYLPNKTADVIVSYHYINKRTEFFKYNKAVKYCSPCLYDGLASKDKKAWEVLAGSLVIDIINKQNQRSVWRSIYALNVKEKDTSFDIQDKMQQAIKMMLVELPKA